MPLILPSYFLVVRCRFLEQLGSARRRTFPRIVLKGQIVDKTVLAYIGMLTSCPFYGGSREIGVAAGAANLRGGAEGTNYGVTVIKLLSRSTDATYPPSSAFLHRRVISCGEKFILV